MFSIARRAMRSDSSTPGWFIRSAYDAPMSQRTSILVATILGSAIVFLDATIVNVALESIGRELASTFVGRLEGLTYVNSAYFAVLAALLLLAGALNCFYRRGRLLSV